MKRINIEIGAEPNFDKTNIATYIREAIHELRKTFPDIGNVVAKHRYLPVIMEDVDPNTNKRVLYAMLDTTRQIPDTFSSYKKECLDSISEATRLRLFDTLGIYHC